MSTNGKQPVIELREITKTYAMGDIEVHALQGATVSMYPGDLVSIMGPSVSISRRVAATSWMGWRPRR
jgi:putative ABC transport system ATP-binding protein